MNRYLLIAACLSAAFAGWSNAQTPSGKDILPPGPWVVTQMPDSAQWTIDYTYADTRKHRKALVKLAGDARPTHVTIVKTGAIRHEIREMERGLKSEFWAMGDMMVERRSNAPKLFAYTSGPKDSEFPEFGWISQTNFTGRKIVDGSDCLVFQQQIDPLQITYPATYAAQQKDYQRDATEVKSDTPTVLAIALVDAKTRLPVSLQAGPELRRYAFLPPPAAMLSVPDEFAAAAKEAKARVDAATKPLSAP